MYSFLKIHTEKYLYQDPITSAHITNQSETHGLSCNTASPHKYITRIFFKAPIDYHFHISSGLMMSTHS